MRQREDAENSIIVKARVLKIVHEYGMIASSDFLQELDMKVRDMIRKALLRAQKNGRVMVRGDDL